LFGGKSERRFFVRKRHEKFGGSSHLFVLVVGVWVLTAVSSASAAVFVDADFDGQSLGPVLTQPATDPLPHTLPTGVIRDAAGKVDVIEGRGDLKRKPVLLASAPTDLASMAFYNPVQITSGKAILNWDALVDVVVGAPMKPTGTGFVLVEQRNSLLESVLIISYKNKGSQEDPEFVLTVEDAEGTREIARVKPLVHDHFELFLDLDAKKYVLVVRDKAEVSGQLKGDGNFSHFVCKSNARGSTWVAPPLVVDNIVIEVMPTGGCRPVDFEDIPVGTSAPYGTAFTSNGVLLSIREFFWGLGGCTNPTTVGNVVVNNQGSACGKGNELVVNNVNVHFDYGAPLSRVQFFYGEYGGNVNLIVNGSCVSRPNFADLPASLGGVLIKVEPPENPGQGCGTVILSGLITSFAVGGQELAIDDILCEARDLTPPVAEITEPSGFECVCSPVEIIGTADDPDGSLDRYTLAYTRDSASGWTVFATGTAPVVDDVLGVWDATGLPEGYYLIRLVVTNSTGLTATDTTSLWLDQEFDSFEVRSPASGSVVGGTVCFDGTVWDHCSVEYRVEFSPDGSSFSPVEPGTPVYTSKVINDPFAHWDTVGEAIPDGKYLVRITATDQCDHEAADEVTLIVDNTPPTAVITSPESCDCVEGAVEIRGTADDANLDYWVLEYTGGDATGWVTIASGNGPKNGILGVWDTTSLRPCAYTIRLRVVDKAVVDCNHLRRHRTDAMVSVMVGRCDLLCEDPICPNAGDLNGDGTVDISDAIYLLRYLFGGGPAPVPAEPTCP